eukprot:94408_1
MPKYNRTNPAHITADTDVCGQLITFMFVVEQKDEIRCYIVWNGETMRFEHNHMELVLPFLFVDNNENIQFIKNGKKLVDLQQVFKHGTKDHVYDKFCKALEAWKPIDDHELIIHKIDKGVGEYYSDMGRKNYFNSNGEGIFKLFCNDNGFEDEDVKEELQETDGNECTLTDFDDDFPFNNIPDNDNDDDKFNHILKV